MKVKKVVEIKKIINKISDEALLEHEKELAEIRKKLTHTIKVKYLSKEEDKILSNSEFYNAALYYDSFNDLLDHEIGFIDDKIIISEGGIWKRPKKQ